MEWLGPFIAGLIIGLIAGVLWSSESNNLKNWRDGGDK